MDHLCKIVYYIKHMYETLYMTLFQNFLTNINFYSMHILFLLLETNYISRTGVYKKNKNILESHISNIIYSLQKL